MEEVDGVEEMEGGRHRRSRMCPLITTTKAVEIRVSSRWIRDKEDGVNVREVRLG